ncbi:MAG: response regulator [Planctomycetaceae bacterium]
MQQPADQFEPLQHTAGAPSIDAVIECNTTGCVTVFSPVAERIFKYSRDEAIGRKLAELIIPERYRDAHSAGLERYLRERHGRILNTTIEIQAIRKNGEEFPIELTVVPYQIGDEIRFKGTLRDITERWQNEERLRRERSRFESLFDNSPVAIWEEDLSTLMQWMQQLRDKGITDFEQYMDGHPDVIAEAVKHIRIMNVNSAAVKQNRADSREHLIDSFHKLCCDAESDAMRAELMALWNGKTIIEFELVSLRIDGERLDVICSLVIPVLDGVPEYNRAIFTGTDVTEIRKSERDLERIRNHQTLDKIGRLAGGIAHDFNNLLTVIVGCADLLKDGLQHDPDKESFANDIIEASLRAKWLTDQLLTFSKRRRNVPVVVNTNDAVTTIAEMLTRVVGEQVDLICATSDIPLCVRLGDGQLEQVLMNLIMNAKDAITTDPRVYITTSQLEITADNQQDFDAAIGSYVHCQVKDQGTGMTAEEMELAFEPFFTTKRRDEGTGLGLATAYGIIKGAQGDIRISSQKDHGTHVDFILPLVKDSVIDDRMQPRNIADSTRNKQIVILVVEDEDEVRKVVYNILTGAGYSVLTADGGRKAIRLCNSFQGTIDLLLTDVMMPDMNGREVAEKIRIHREEIKVMFMTGYDDSIVDSVMDVTTLHDIIEKPFTARSLCKSVKRVLDTSEE